MSGRRFSSVVLTVVMLVAAVGVGAYQQEGWCPMLKLPDCCKKARSKESGASITRVCCNSNFFQPGSNGKNSSSSFSLQLSTTMNAAVAVNTAGFSSKVLFTPQVQRPYSYDSNPRYIKHL